MNQKILIAPASMHRALLQEKRSVDIFSNIKIFSKEKLIDEYLGYFPNEAIVELMILEKINYDTARSFLIFLPFVDKENNNLKIDRLIKMKKNLIEKNLYHDNPYLKIAMSDKEIEIYGYDENDFYLNKILKNISSRGCEKFFSNKREISKETVLESFKNVESEIHYVMNQIAIMIKNGIYVEKIKLLGVDETYLYQVEKYAKMYGINLNGLPTKSLFLTTSGREFLNSYKKSKDYEIALLEIFGDKELNNEEVMVKTAIENHRDKRLSFESQYDIYRSVLKETHLAQNEYKEAIEIITEDNGKKDQEIFVIGFRQGAYPLSRQDNDYLNENEKKTIGYISSEKQNEETLFSLINFFKSDNNFHFSFAESDLTSDFLPSFIASDNDFKIERPSLGLLDCSSLASKIELVKMLDLKDKYATIDSMMEIYQKALPVSYKTYNHSFSGVLAIENHSELVHSYSSLNSFISCQFKYYVENILKIADDTENFHLKIGNLGHFIFEKCLQEKEKFDFEKEFVEGYENIKKYTEWSDQDDVLLVSIKKYFEAACKNILDHDRNLTNPSYALEKTLSFPLCDHSIFKGKVDKIITVGDYVYVVDYKTGNEMFNRKIIPTYRSLQLPSYALLIRNSEEYKNKIIGGLYTNNVIDFSFENPSLALTHPYLKLNGVTVFDDKIIDAIEPNYKNGQTSFVKIDLSKNAPTPKMLEKKELITTDQLDKYIEFTRQKYIECDEEIRKNNFVINPKKYKSSSDKTVCEYCTLKGICFHEFEDVVLIEDSKNKNAEENSDEME